MLLPAICFCLARLKSAGLCVAIWCFVSRAAESEREEGAELALYLPLVPRCCLAIFPLAISLSLPPWLCITTLSAGAGSAKGSRTCTDI